MSSEPIRLSGTSYAVLGLIDAWGPCTPYDLKQAIETTVENFWPVPHTTFYAEPDRLAKAGLLAVEQEEGGRRKKLYSITPSGKEGLEGGGGEPPAAPPGREALEAWVPEPTAAPPQLRDELVLKIFLGAAPEPLAAERIEFHR